MKGWFVVFAVALGGMVWTGCGSDTGGVELAVDPSEVGRDAGADTAARSNAADKIYRRPSLPETPLEEERSFVMINNGAGIFNADFNEAIEMVPTYWHVEFGPVRMQTAAGPDQSPAVRMGPGYNYNFLSQELEFDESPAGKTLTLTAQSRAAEPNTAKIMIRVTEAQKAYSEAHPGDDGWHELKVTTQVPQDFQGNTIGIFLTHSGSPKKAAFYDRVRLSVN